MADESDVEKALVDLIDGLLYPGGTEGLAANAPSALGAPAKVQRGDPLSLQLESDIKAGVVDFAVFARNGVERDATRYFRDWQVLVPAVRTITVSPPGPAITLGGTVSTPQNIAVAWGNAAEAVYAVQANDTLEGIVGALAADLAAQGAPVTVSGATLAITSGPDLRARVGGVATVVRELRRQEKSFQVTIFAPDPDLRDAAAKLIDIPFSDINFFTLPDLSRAKLRYERTIIIDTSEKMGEYRRDLFYWVEYPTTETKTATEVVSFNVAVSNLVAQSTIPHQPIIV